jgi:hypothetical protein
MPIEIDSDRAIFFHPDEFGTSALYAPAEGVAVALDGIFDRPTIGSGINDVVTLDSRPTFLCCLIDLPVGVDGETGDQLTVDGETFAVTSIEPDGQGMALLRLGAAD